MTFKKYCEFFSNISSKIFSTEIFFLIIYNKSENLSENISFKNYQLQLFLSRTFFSNKDLKNFSGEFLNVSKTFFKRLRNIYLKISSKHFFSNLRICSECKFWKFEDSFWRGEISNLENNLVLFLKISETL